MGTGCWIKSIRTALQSSPQDMDIAKKPFVSTILSRASARRTSSASHGSFISKAYRITALLCASIVLSSTTVSARRLIASLMLFLFV
jgi:hypothetical protein